PKAAMYDNKRIYQPTEIVLLDTQTVRIKIKNRAVERNLNHYQPIMLIRENGEVVKEVELPDMDLAAGDSTEMDLLSYIPVKQKQEKEYQLDIQFRLEADELWAPAGLVVSSSQLRWQELGSVMK